MGLKEQLDAGATSLNREKIYVDVTGANQYVGSVALGRTFVIVGSQTTKPCRIRLYGNSASRDDVTELARPFISQSIPASISLLADINLTDTSLFKLHPPLFGANLDTSVSSTIYYTITSSSVDLSSGVRVNLDRFIMEDIKVVGLPEVVTRNTCTISGSVTTGNSISGSLTTPKTYLLLQVIPSTSPVRLRLYSNDTYRDDPTEKARTFGVEPKSSSGIIADMYMSVTETSSFTPIVLGRNMKESPVPITYYTLTNESVASTVTASLYLFSLED